MMWAVVFSAFLFAGAMLYVIYKFSHHEPKKS
jgi:hypothetical protein